jgi:hypothetical protein
VTAAAALLALLTASAVPTEHGPPDAGAPAPVCHEASREVKLVASSGQLEQVLALLSKGLKGQRYTLEDGTSFTVTSVHDLAWRGGVEGVADIDFDHRVVAGSGTLPVRLEVSLDKAAQRLVPKVRLTGSIRIVKSRAKDEAGGLDFLAQGGGRLVEALSQTPAFRDEFSRRAEASLQPPSLAEMVRAVMPQLGLSGMGCVARARIDQWAPSLDGLTLAGNVTLSGPDTRCCH